MLRTILKNNNVYCVIAEIKYNKNVIVLNNNKLEIYSKRTNNFLGYCTIEQLIKYEHKINYLVTNEFLYYLSEIEKINKYNSSVEATI